MAKRRGGEMMLISILGASCNKCHELYENAVKAVSNSGQEVQVEKITDIVEIAAMGVMVTPALAIDRKVKSTGRVLTVDEIVDLIK